MIGLLMVLVPVALVVIIWLLTPQIRVVGRDVDRRAPWRRSPETGPPAPPLPDRDENVEVPRDIDRMTA
jgi:hypothetical protein